MNQSWTHAHISLTPTKSGKQLTEDILHNKKNMVITESIPTKYETKHEPKWN